VQARIEPAAAIAPLRLTERGALKGIRGLSLVANLDMRIAERQRDRALRRLADRHNRIEIEAADIWANTKGTALILLAEFKQSGACYSALGALGKRAEQVADEACLWLEKFLAGAGAVDEYLADQLLLPLAFAAGPSEYRTAKVTEHLLTNAEVIQAFGAAEVEVEGEKGKAGVVRVVGSARSV
jgi:RNA 3'-terminal phosphate cyclase (ATP)